MIKDIHKTRLQQQYRRPQLKNLLYVMPDYRRRGLYRLLYEFVKKEAEADDTVCGFRLYVDRDNLTAQKTYAALGMEETAYKLYEEMKVVK